MWSFLSALALGSCLVSDVLATRLPIKRAANSTSVIKPKVFIVSMFAPEEETWYGIKEFNILEMNITLPGASPLYPDVHCTSSGEICQLTTGEAGEQCRQGRKGA